MVPNHAGKPFAGPSNSILNDNRHLVRIRASLSSDGFDDGSRDLAFTCGGQLVFTDYHPTILSDHDEEDDESNEAAVSDASSEDIYNATPTRQSRAGSVKTGTGSTSSASQTPHREESVGMSVPPPTFALKPTPASTGTENEQPRAKTRITKDFISLTLSPDKKTRAPNADAGSDTTPREVDKSGTARANSKTEKRRPQTRITKDLIDLTLNPEKKTRSAKPEATSAIKPTEAGKSGIAKPAPSNSNKLDAGTTKPASKENNNPTLGAITTTRPITRSIKTTLEAAKQEAARRKEEKEAQENMSLVGDYMLSKMSSQYQGSSTPSKKKKEPLAKPRKEPVSNLDRNMDTRPHQEARPPTPSKSSQVSKSKENGHKPARVPESESKSSQPPSQVPTSEPFPAKQEPKKSSQLPAPKAKPSSKKSPPQDQVSDDDHEEFSPESHITLRWDATDHRVPHVQTRLDFPPRDQSSDNIHGLLCDMEPTEFGYELAPEFSLPLLVLMNVA